MQFEFQPDEEMQALFDITAYFLKTFFGYEESNAVKTIEQYYAQWKHVHDDDFYHEIMSFEIAVRVHYFITLQGDEDKYVFWRRDNGLNQQPPEAAEYFRKHYFRDVAD